MHRDAFCGVHPVIEFVLLAFALIVPMLLMHPVIIAITFVSGLVWSCMLKGRAAFGFLLKVVLPVMLIAAVLNPLFNHRGFTTLFYLRDNPVTAESIYYGVTASASFGAVLIWFSCFNEVMTSDKIIYVFGRLAPSISLLISMTLRFVPLFKRQARKISLAQEGMGGSVSQGNILSRARHGLSIMSALITWGLESAVTTADSMRSRGSGLHGRTQYSPYRLDSRDIALSAVTVLCMAALGFASVRGRLSIKFYPMFVMKQEGVEAVIALAGYALLLFVPILMDIKEEIVWRSLKSKI